MIQDRAAVKRTTGTADDNTGPDLSVLSSGLLSDQMSLNTLLISLQLVAKQTIVAGGMDG